MKYINTKLLILTLALIGLASTNVFAKPDKLSTEQWELVQINGRAINDSKAYLEINIGRTRFTGNTGCNQMFGNVAVNGSRLMFSNIGATKMFCGKQDVNRVEKTYLNALEKVTRYRQTRNSLELMDRNRVILKFKVRNRQGPGDPQKIRLEDKKWMLEAIKGSPVSKAGSSAFVVFDKQKKSAGGNSNCNVFGGSYEAKGSTLSITDVMSTMTACEEGDRMKVERELFDGLKKANRYEIENGRLMLYRDRRLLLTFISQKK